MKKRLFKSPRIGLGIGIFAALQVAPISGQAPTASPKEALILRRITEYWKDRDYPTVKTQIIRFLKENPHTALYDHLNAILGDLYFQEQNYRQALATYDLIVCSEIREKTFFNRLQAQFEMGDFLTAIESSERFFQETRGHPLEIKVRYLLAEANFRYALQCTEIDEKIFYLKKAKPHYKILTQTSYADRVLFPLAEIHRLLREDGRAIALYLNLADKYPKHRERFLFQAAILQIKEDKKAASRTFAKVYELGGKRSRLAAFNRLILLYQTQNYNQFLDEFEEVIALMPEQKVPLLNFYQGRCHYFLGDYNQAVMPLEACITKMEGRSKELRASHLLLVNCSRYLNDMSLLERTLYSFKKTFPKDTEVPKILLMHAQMCREGGKLSQALSDLQMLMADYPQYGDLESVLYDQALILSQMDKWKEARISFFTFLEKYPNSDKQSSAWRHLLNCSIEEIKNPSQKESMESKEVFVTILHRLLQEDRVLSKEEKEQYALAMMKCQCEMGRYADVIPTLSQYIANCTNEQYLADAHLLMAICQQKSGEDVSLFIDHAEQALSYQVPLPQQHIIHLELYNAYLSQSNDPYYSTTTDYLLEKAADHLYTSSTWKDGSIKLDNQLWLANYYYEKAVGGCQMAQARAQEIFYHLLGAQSENVSLTISSDSLFLEGEVLKFAHLLHICDKGKEAVALLEKLAKKQEQHPQLPWKLKRRTLLELAKSYESIQKFQQALHLYRHLTESDKRISSMVTNTAKLHYAKLYYQTLKKEKKTRQNPEMISILHTLKDLQIQKRLEEEPIHLESALQYAEIRAVLSEGDGSEEGRFFLKRMFDDFQSQTDPIVQEYNRLKEEHADKAAIVTAYMDYLSAKIMQYDAHTARRKGKVEMALSLEREALDLLDALLQREKDLKPYLFDRVEKAKGEIAKQ